MHSSNAARQILPALARDQKPSVANHIAEVVLGGELGYALDKVLVAVAIAGNQLADEGNRAEAPALVEGVEDGIGDFGELQTGKDAARFQDAEGFAQGAVLMREVADAEGDRVQVDAGVGNSVERFGVGLQEFQTGGARVGGLQGALLALGEHVGVDVGDGDAGMHIVVDGGSVVQHAEGNVACAAGDVEDIPAFLIRGRRGEGIASGIEAPYKFVFPQPVDA